MINGMTNRKHKKIFYPDAPQIRGNKGEAITEKPMI
jgi:hypothetical protein